MNLHSRSRHVRYLPKIRTIQQQSTFVSVVILLFGPSFSPSLLSPSVCSAAPALWSPITDALESLLHLHGATKEEINIPPVPSPVMGTSGTATPSSAKATVTAEDYGVVQLDLEGDPNCDYTTKVRIAGSEVRDVSGWSSSRANSWNNLTRTTFLTFTKQSSGNK